MISQNISYGENEEILVRDRTRIRSELIRFLRKSTSGSIERFHYEMQAIFQELNGRLGELVEEYFLG